MQCLGCYILDVYVCVLLFGLGLYERKTFQKFQLGLLRPTIDAGVLPNVCTLLIYPLIHNLIVGFSYH